MYAIRSYYVVINQGNFGSYKASMFGPELGLIFDKKFLNNMLGVELNLFGNPLYENEVTLSGWSENPTEDYARGKRFGASLFADAHFMKLYAGIGYP